MRRLGLLLAIGGLCVACSNSDGSATGTASDADGDSADDDTAGDDSGGGPSSGSADDDGGTSGGDDDSTSSSGTGSDDTGGDDGGSPQGCDPFPPAEDPVVMASPGDDLAQIVGNAASGTTILLADGMYDLSGSNPLYFTTPGLTLRSQSGDRDKVVLDGGYGLGEIALVAASDTTIADVTLQRAMWHPIHVTGTDSANVENMMIYNVSIIDPGQQAIKINASSAGFYSDNGTVACSSVVLTDAGRSQIRDNCYTGGIDAHSAWGWKVYDNYFEGYWCEQGLSEHAIHFWITGRDTLVERNTIVDCARGIGFGLGSMGNGKERVYPDNPCPGASYLGHVDGLIRNNTVFAARAELFASQSGFDSGVALEQACGAEVYHNTIASLQQPFVSIEYRFGNTDAKIKNNLVTHSIAERDAATAELDGNIADAPLSHFVDGNGGNLHLDPGSPAIDAGVSLPTGKVDQDMDGEDRDASPDVGADEHVQ